MATTNQTEEQSAADGESRATNMLTISSDEQSLPPRASFMGLAVETRLQIYGYLLTPTLTKEERAKLERKRHCCQVCYRSPNNVVMRLRPTRDDSGEITCECAGSHTHPQILCTSKQVFEEAMPVLYENMELRVPITGYPTSLYNPLTQRLPDYAMRHISKVRIFGIIVDALASHLDDEWQWQTNIWLYCDYLREKLPKLRHLRMHLDCDYTAFSMPDTKTFGAIATLPELRSVRVCVCRPMTNVTVAQAKGLQAEIVKAVERRAQAIGREITIIEE